MSKPSCLSPRFRRLPMGLNSRKVSFSIVLPHAFRTLVGRDRFRLDFILEGWTDESGIQRPAPLNTLTAAYAIHMDVNAKQGKGGYDANWGPLHRAGKKISKPAHSMSSPISPSGAEAKKPMPPAPRKSGSTPTTSTPVLTPMPPITLTRRNGF